MNEANMTKCQSFNPMVSTEFLKKSFMLKQWYQKETEL